MKRVLITGAAGFLGRHISRHFNEQGWAVHGLDTVSPENAPVAYLRKYSLLQLPDVRFTSLLQDEPPDLCIHCAGRASVPQSVVDPAADFYSSPVLTFEILNALRANAPSCGFIFLSSAAVYGNPAVLPIDEAQGTAPISPYGFHKLQGEILCQEFARVYGLPTASVRIFSAYGPGLRRQVMWDICQQATKNKSLVLQGTGRESRDFVHAADIARGIEIVALSSQLQGEVYNLASGREATILELSRLILNNLEMELDLQFNQHVPEGVPLNWRADISKIKDLGFRPKITLESGVKAFVNWCRLDLNP